MQPTPPPATVLSRAAFAPPVAEQAPIVLSFDVEEHDRIEAAAGVGVSSSLRSHYRTRLDISTRWLLQRLEAANTRATFFIVGEIARHNPTLVRDIHRAGHEVASHGWAHRRVHTFTPEAFRDDLRQSIDALEQVIGEAVLGYRAPTFSIVRSTAWALDVLAEEGIRYDSSVYPVRHDRYGVPGAPCTPFRAGGVSRTLLELPVLAWRCLGARLPVGGGGYFRLLPLWFMRRGIAQMQSRGWPALAMLYFHPWEFDVEQARLPLGRLASFRTYVGIGQSRRRLERLLQSYTFVRARDAVARIHAEGVALPEFSLGEETEELSPLSATVGSPAPVAGAVEA